MSNIIPPLLSNSPPPPPSPEEDEDDEFGDFTGANDLSYGCDNLSLPPSPDHTSNKTSILNGLDINSNSDKNKVEIVDLGIEKDFQDKRKGSGTFEHFRSSKENCIENTKENHLEHFENSVGHIVQDNILGSSNASCENNCDLNYIHDEIVHHEINNENMFLGEQKADESVECDELKTQNTNDSSTMLEDKQRPLNFTVTSDTMELNTVCTEEKEMFNVTVKFETDQQTNELVVDNSDNKTSESELDLGNRSIFEELHSISNETNDHKKISETTESNEDIHVEENLRTSSPCLKEGNIDLIETSKTKICSNEDEVWTTFENESVAHKENACREKISTDEGFGDFAFGGDFKNTIYREVEPTGNDYEKFKSIQNIEGKIDNTTKDSAEITATSAVTTSDSVEKTVDSNIYVEDEFDDFCEFTSSTVIPEHKEAKAQSLEQADDDFSNFANFSQVVEEPVILLLNEKQALEKSDSILKTIFPAPENVDDDFQNINIERGDFIFNELKDITETNALTFQWSKSSSQNMLLKSLNIDARNILYGASWNRSMPRFAANLGLTPLQPIKTESPASSTLKSSPSTSSQPSSGDIPSAQFDWNGSGLVNPLDYLEQLVASLDIPTCNPSSNSNNSSSPANELNDWDIWLQTVSKESMEVSQISESEKFPDTPVKQSILQPQVVAKPPTSEKTPSKNDLEVEVISSEQNIDEVFEDFTSYQTPTGSETWSNIVPLRETYISNDVKELPLDITNWLQPTIVTPELPRKDLELGDEDLPNIQTPEFTRKQAEFEENDDDFDDFQMVLPETSGPTKTIPVQLIEQFKEEPVSSNLKIDIYDFSNLTFPEDKQKKKTPINFVNNIESNKPMPELKKIEEQQPVLADDDDFTEFHSSVPAPQSFVPKPLTPILEPLKPIPIQPTVSVAAPTQINWPDPGITEDEIKKFEMVFKRPQEYNKKDETREDFKKVSDKIKGLSNNGSFDDDEWSDFVSVQKPSPVHKLQSSEKERTSSPDLPLSVLNLGNLQPTKQPIPVITPQGLIQTKLSSSNSVNMSPKTQLKNNTMIQQKLQVHPSIISTQFASEVYSFNNVIPSQNKSVLNLNQPQSSSSNQQPLDDDDWSDFISSPLPSTTANGFQQSWQNTSTYSQSNWASPSPNIITNPRHYVQSGSSDIKNKKVSSLSVNSKKSTIPSISLPDLEFIAPKGRTSSSRKK